MFGLSWLKIGFGLAVLAAAAGLLVWALQPWFAQRANEKAAGKVTAVVAAAKPQVAAAVAEEKGKSDGKVENLNTKSVARQGRIVSAPDPYPEFYAGMCERELYKADPECGSGGRKPRPH